MCRSIGGGGVGGRVFESGGRPTHRFGQHYGHADNGRADSRGFSAGKECRTQPRFESGPDGQWRMAR
eukprot:5568412-Lingulodinium_polyedra.AAC.1